VRISVIIPAYNASPFIAEALDSVAAQTAPALEVVVVDDGSTDDTVAVLRAWAARNGVPVTVHAQANAGVSVARNIGMNLAEGDWIALLDADDVWLPEHLAVLTAVAQHFPTAPTVFGDTVHFDQAGAEYPPFSRDKALRCAVATKDQHHLLTGDRFFEGSVPGLFLCPSAAMVRRDAALAIGGFDPAIRYVEDRDFFLRMAWQGPVAFADCVVSRNRIHDSNITHPRNSQRNALQMIKLLQKLRNAKCNPPMSPQQRELVAHTLAQTLRTYLYVASNSGLRNYRKALADLATLGPVPRSAFRPRRLGRALASSLWPGRRRET
jgi:glycosyltransferase involved in cell wall biosynthesis